MEPSLQHKISKNPFYHIQIGLGNVLKTNLGALIGAYLFQLLVTALLFVGIISLTGILISFGAGSDIVTSVVSVVVAVILGLILTIIPTLTIERIILTGARLQKSSLSEAIKLSLSRVGVSIMVSLFILLIYIAISIVLGGVGALLGPVVAPFGLLLIPLFIIAVIRLAYTIMILVDDDKPTSAMQVIKHSSALAKKSAKPIIAYWTVVTVLYIAFQLFVSSVEPEVSAFYGPNLISTILYVVLGTLISVSMQAGFTNIYNEVKGTVSTNASASNNEVPAHSVQTGVAAAQSQIAPVAPQQSAQAPSIATEQQQDQDQTPTQQPPQTPAA